MASVDSERHTFSIDFIRDIKFSYVPPKTVCAPNHNLIHFRMREQSGLVRSGKLFGGLVADLKRKRPFYLSDFTQGIHSQCISSFLFLYFACLAPIVVFGGLLGEATGNQIATIESLISGCSHVNMLSLSILIIIIRRERGRSPSEQPVFICSPVGSLETPPRGMDLSSQNFHGSSGHMSDCIFLKSS